MSNNWQELANTCRWLTGQLSNYQAKVIAKHILLPLTVMNYLTLIETIIENLRRAGEDEYANQVYEAFRYSFTSSELLLKVTHELLEILKESRNRGEHKVVALLEQDVMKLNAFCNSIGLYPH